MRAEVTKLKNNKKQDQSIREQIFSGYRIVILITVIVVAVSIVYLGSIYNSYCTLAENRENQGATQEAISKHYEWLEWLNESLQTGEEFQGSLDATSCSLGKWLGGLNQDEIQSTQIAQAVQAIQKPHQQIHTDAAEVLAMAQTDRAAAYTIYLEKIKPNALETISYLTTISDGYAEIATEASNQLVTKIRLSIITSVILALAGILLSFFFAKSSAKKISQPIAYLTTQAKQMAMGMDIDTISEIHTKEELENSKNEVNVLLSSFLKMANSVQENSNVLERVAKGDMTVFVNIRSKEDTLGKSLYHMVQSNDLTFANILQIANDVAVSAHQIAETSHSLAENSSIQAASVQELTETIHEANVLVEQNVEKTNQADTISNTIRNKVYESTEEMKTLLSSVEEIREASEKISYVIKSIEDIAFQTNILSLNASVEAARAGEAGKGFAVVADEVRDLALRSADAAKNSRELIQNTINKTALGVEVSNKAFDTFSDIVQRVDEILGLIVEIAAASESQKEYMGNIRGEISRINDVVSSNAAASEESSAASVSMSKDAEVLRKEIRKFNLRKRIPGHAYIPPEKQNDIGFIKEAEENYKQFHHLA